MQRKDRYIGDSQVRSTIDLVSKFKSTSSGGELKLSEPSTSDRRRLASLWVTSSSFQRYLESNLIFHNPVTEFRVDVRHVDVRLFLIKSADGS